MIICPEVSTPTTPAWEAAALNASVIFVAVLSAVSATTIEG